MCQTCYRCSCPPGFHLPCGEGDQTASEGSPRWTIWQEHHFVPDKPEYPDTCLRCGTKHGSSRIDGLANQAKCECGCGHVRPAPCIQPCRIACGRGA